MLKAVDEEEIRKAYIRMYDGMIAKDEKVLQEVLDDSFVHKGLGRLRYRSGRRKADVHRTSCAPTSFEPGRSGEKGSGGDPRPCLRITLFCEFLKKFQKSSRLSPTCDTMKLTLFGKSIIV